MSTATSDRPIERSANRLRRRRLIVNADDFGRSTSINKAVIRAHREGILTTASLMVGENAFDEAVALAHENPRLGVGLHLTLLCGHSVLPHQAIPGLVNPAREFQNNPTRVGFSYFFRPSLKEQIRAEIRAQFEKFKATGLLLDHVNGHLHLHLHPTVFKVLIEDAPLLGFKRMRLTSDPFRLNRRLAKGHWVYCATHALIHRILSGRARPVLARLGIGHTDRVFGLLQNARVDQPFIQGLLPLLPPGDSELYSHPSLDEFRHEFDALISLPVRELIHQLDIELIRYQDL